MSVECMPGKAPVLACRPTTAVEQEADGRWAAEATAWVAVRAGTALRALRRTRWSLKQQSGITCCRALTGLIPTGLRPEDLWNYSTPRPLVISPESADIAQS
jgi:hypothetical protein